MEGWATSEEEEKEEGKDGRESPTSLPLHRDALTGCREVEGVFLSQKELEQEFDCFSNSASPQSTSSPSPTFPFPGTGTAPSPRAETEASVCGVIPNQGPSHGSIPSATAGMGSATESDSHSLTILASSKEASYSQVREGGRRKKGGGGGGGSM